MERALAVKLVPLLSALGALALAAAPAWGQSFPVSGKPVRILVGFAAGGGTDIQARLVAPKLADALGVPVVVENRPGASTMLAAQEVARAAPEVKDGFEKGAYEAVSSTPEELGALTRESYDRWGRIIQDLGIKPQ